MKQLTQSKKKVGLFRYLGALTCFLILFELSIFTKASDLYLGDYQLIADNLKIPVTVLPGIFYFLFAQIFLHLAFLMFIWGVSRLLGVAMKRIKKHIDKWGLGIWVLGLLTILLMNQVLYPNSKFAPVTGLIVHSPFVAKILLCILIIFWLVTLTIALYGLILILLPRAKLAFSLLGLMLLGVCVVAISQNKFEVADAATAQKPNIIIIGVDAVRPDFLGFFGGNKSTPHMDDFLNNATVFADALTPLARTYPSWVSILTGEYPKKTNVRFNLSKEINFDLQKTLPAILRDHGYETIYAMDETRFSNIDKSFGFDKTVTPPVGFNDFLVGTINDFPISNLVINTKLGKFLFPYSYGNRPVYTTYDPNSFLKLLNDEIERPRNKPIFLAVHFCLAHYPYVWARLKYNSQSVTLYQAALQRADKQFSEFIKILEKNKLLEHSIVVLLSDHGEAFWLNGDRVTEEDLFIAGKNNKKKTLPEFYPAGKAEEKVNQSVGHGTDVLGLSQSHSLLAFRFFGLDGQKADIIPGWTSLIDIKPTLLYLLKIDAPKQSGKSLANFILGKKSAITQPEDFFIESDFSPEAIRSVHPETRKIIFQGISYFEINPLTTRLTVRDSMAKLIISSKQYADFYGPWILALYPQSDQTMTPILVNLETGLWTNDLKTRFATQSPAKHMLAALKRFYGSDIRPVVDS